MTRKYEMRRRADRQEQTRRRIVEATVALHEEVGVIRTSISDIAGRAGVERATVYRHFPDERALLTACIGHYSAQHPPPDPDAWQEMTDPAARLRTGLTEIYTYHRHTERMVSRTTHELPDLPIAQEVVASMVAYWARMRDVLAAGWSVNDRQKPILTAAVGHAIGFLTWRSLVREQGLDDAQAIEMMVTLVDGLSRDGDDRQHGD